MNNEPINRQIEETTIYVFGKNPDGSLIYSRPFTTEEVNAVAGSVNHVIKTEYGNADGLRQGIGVAKDNALYNMNTFKGILANRELMRQSSGDLWLPTIQESLLLHKGDMFPDSVLTDFGFVLYSDSVPNKGIAHSLASDVSGKYSFPIVASFKSLGLEASGEEYGITPKIVSADGLITGRDVDKVLENFVKGDSGVRRLDRGRCGVLHAYWDDLDYFDEGCRVGRVSAVGSAKNLIELAEGEIRAKYDKGNEVTRKGIASLEKKIATLQSQLGQLEINRQTSIKSIKQLLT